MDLKEAYIGINAEIRRMEGKMNGQKVNHVLHLLLSIVTAGFWIPIWILVVLANTNVLPTSGKLEELYELRDEAELKLKMKGMT